MGTMERNTHIAGSRAYGGDMCGPTMQPLNR
jgi:hypothetical protein